MEVSVLVYLDVSNRPCITTASKYHSKPVVKKELRANDNTAVIKLVLYDEQIAQVPTDGVYNISSATLRQYVNGVSVLHCSSKACIKKSDTVITPSNIKVPNLETRVYKFPPISIIVCKTFTRTSCKKEFSSSMHTITSRLIKCPDCKAVAKAESFPFHYDLKLKFSSEFEQQ